MKSLHAKASLHFIEIYWPLSNTCMTVIYLFNFCSPTIYVENLNLVLVDIWNRNQPREFNWGYLSLFKLCSLLRYFGKYIRSLTKSLNFKGNQREQWKTLIITALSILIQEKPKSAAKNVRLLLQIKKF